MTCPTHGAGCNPHPDCIGNPTCSCHDLRNAPCPEVDEAERISEKYNHQCVLSLGHKGLHQCGSCSHEWEAEAAKKKEEPK